VTTRTFARAGEGPRAPLRPVGPIGGAPRTRLRARRGLLFPVLACLLGTAAAGADDKSIRDETSNFEVAVPPEKAGDWDRMQPDEKRKDVKAHFRTEFTGTEPLAVAEVQVILFPLKKDLATRALESIATQWSSLMEGSLTNHRDLKEGKTTLGGQEAYFRDVKGDLMTDLGAGHVTWHLARMGKFVYVFHVVRTYKAVGDEGLEEEITKIRDSFKFLKVEQVTADPKAKGGAESPAGPAGAGSAATPTGPDPALLVRVEMKFDHWKVKFVKPEGLLGTPPDKFEESEMTNHVIAKFTRSADQTNIMIRVYAQLEKAQKYTIEMLADNVVKYFNQRYAEKNRKPPEIDKDYKKFPLAKDAIMIRLIGRRTVPELDLWYIAQCKNGRQYQIEIHMTGSEGEKAWKSQVDDFMKNFKPFDD